MSDYSSLRNNSSCLEIAAILVRIDLIRNENFKSNLTKTKLNFKTKSIYESQLWFMYLLQHLETNQIPKNLF